MDSLFSDKPRWNTSLKKRLAQVCKHDKVPSQTMLALFCFLFFAGPEYGQFLMLFILHHHCPSCFGWCNEPCHHLDRAAPKPPGQHSNSHDLCSLPVMVGTAQTWCQNTMAHLQIDDHPITYLRRFPKSWGYPQIIQIGPYLSIF